MKYLHYAARNALFPAVYGIHHPKYCHIWEECYCLRFWPITAKFWLSALKPCWCRRIEILSTFCCSDFSFEFPLDCLLLTYWGFTTGWACFGCYSWALRAHNSSNMSRRYDLGEQDSRASGGSRANRHKVTVKVCMLDDSVVKFDLEVRAICCNMMVFLLSDHFVLLLLVFNLRAMISLMCFLCPSLRITSQTLHNSK